MWQNLSLRMRLILPLGTMFVAALLLGAVSLQLFAPAQLVDESEPASRSAKVVAEALNSALLTSANPQQTLDAFVQALGTSEAIRFRRTGIRNGHAFAGRDTHLRLDACRTGSSIFSACRRSAPRFR